jgi:hypothetical protein
MNYAQPPMMPVAKALANQGRMSDSTLVHMNPQEVAGLQSLARQSGTSLTINPQTGLPEAFNLRSVIPAVAGAALTPVLGPAAPLVVGGLGALMTGSLEQGLMMGLGAYGGAGLASSLAGTAANLAAPAAAAPTIGAEVAAAELAAANAAAQQAAVQQATAMNLPGGAPTDVFGNVLGIDEMAVAGGQGVSAGLPSTVSRPPVSGLSKFFEPDENVTYENIGKGFKNVFSSGESAMNFLGDNKMNLAMSAAPMLISPEEKAAEDRRRAMIRPYEYEVENLTGTDVDPYGAEAERLRGRFVARDPYYAAQGGLMAFAEGGATSGESSTPAASTAPVTQSPAAQTPSSLFINLSPSEAEAYRNIFAVQQMAGVPLSLPRSGITALPSAFTMSSLAPAPAVVPASTVAYTPSMVGTAPALDTSEKLYTVFDPIAAQKARAAVKPNKIDPFYVSPRELHQMTRGTPYTLGVPTYDEYLRGTGDHFGTNTFHNPFYGNAKGGLIKSNKSSVKDKQKKVSRSDPFYEFGLDMNKIAEEQFVGGGMVGYSYDPTTNSYKMAGGGLTSLKAGGLREGAFIVPADVISHLGNGSSEAGMRIVQERLKGRPIKGPGDGMSDSIPTTIAGKQPARVANEEAEIPPEVVAALGGGSLEKGAKKLYEMMDKIRQDRTGKKKQAPAVKADKYMPA